MSGAGIVWHELRPLTAELFRCDLCGEQADTVHLVPWCDKSCEAALFACPRHDPGGYHFPVQSYLEEWIDWKRHLAEKLDPRDREPGGLGLLLWRLEALTYPLVGPDGLGEETPEPSASQNGRTAAAPQRDLAAGEITRYGQAALTGLTADVRNASEGFRNNALNKAAFRAGQLVAAGQIAEGVARGELIIAALDAGLGRREAETTTTSGLAAGLKHPARIEPR